MESQPETYFVTNPTPYVPNSPLPVLVYRDVLALNATPESVRRTIEPNEWLQGGIFKHYSAHHFHSLCHECYAIFKGSSTLLLGRGPLDKASENDLKVSLSAGDIIVLPAGVSHCSLHSDDDYEYVGLYPKGSPHWDNNFCKAGEEETAEKLKNARSVPIPVSDPIFGLGGPLVRIWTEEINKAAMPKLEP